MALPWFNSGVNSVHVIGLKRGKPCQPAMSGRRLVFLFFAALMLITAFESIMISFPEDDFFTPKGDRGDIQAYQWELNNGFGNMVISLPKDDSFVLRRDMSDIHAYHWERFLGGCSAHQGALLSVGQWAWDWHTASFALRMIVPVGWQAPPKVG